MAPSHSREFRLRRATNWIIMGFGYAFLYMGRYNLNAAKTALGDAMTKTDYGTITAVGFTVYAFSFLINGPLVARFGGRRCLLFGLFGAMVANILMGSVLFYNWADGNVLVSFSILYGINMYFQSFGAVAIVSIKAPWFHISERGTFSTIFGVIITTGIYFAFDWGYAIADVSRATAATDPGFFGGLFATIFGLGGTGVNQDWALFWIPALFIGIFWIANLLFLRDTPADAGFNNFDTGEGALSADAERLPVKTAIKRIVTHPVLGPVLVIEFCSGVLRQAAMNWYPIFAKELGFKDDFWITANWGLTMFICGFIGANATGWVTDKFFRSRRMPMCTVSYGLMLLGCMGMYANLGGSLWLFGLSACVIMAGVIAVHGIMAGTVTADFGGVKNVGIVVGIVDAVVYLGGAFQSIAIPALVPKTGATVTAEDWERWPILMGIFAFIGVVMLARIWSAFPEPNNKEPST